MSEEIMNNILNKRVDAKLRQEIALIQELNTKEKLEKLAQSIVNASVSTALFEYLIDDLNNEVRR